MLYVNKSLRICSFPNCSYLDVCNYRPVGPKMFEREMVSQLYAYFD